MPMHRPLWVRVIAYIVVTVIVYLLLAGAVVAIFGEGMAQRVGAAGLAVVCLVAGRYISQRVWGKGTVAK